MRVYRTEALILRCRNYGEADRLLTLLTPERGKVSAIAKGVRKPKSRLRAGTQPLTHCHLVLYEGRNLHTITQAEALESFAGLQGDIDRFAHASLMAELVDKFSPEQGGSDLYPLLLTFWHLLTVFSPPIVTRLFELRLLALLGYCPELYHCIDCGEPLDEESSFAEGKPVNYSPSLGGIIGHCCRHRHPDALSVATSTIALLRHMLVMDPRHIERIKAGEKVMGQVTKMLRDTIRCRHDGHVRSWSVLEDLSTGKADFSRSKEP
ncbi:DNA repair protein RecO [Heliobacillus mobilis]|uniref:DNA repair protein RecO n=1 Tax=Heliobacterium mobile TaxID=28064 RepID=A0A6I3SMF7_HELMO|nr:DNA repair protein RecO [Heliobacterium mobile]MTV50154.1 DNA repair protein RecO [Heliobacterium mobile]